MSKQHFGYIGLYVLLKFTVFNLLTVATRKLHMYLTLYWTYVGQYQFIVYSLLCGPYTSHLGLFGLVFIDIQVRLEGLWLLAYSPRYMNKEKLGTAVEFVGQTSELLLIVTWALPAAWIWGIPFSGSQAGNTCGASGAVRCMLGFSSWKPE